MNVAERQVVLTGQGALTPRLAPIAEQLDTGQLGVRFAGQVVFDPEAAFAGKNYRVIDRLGQLVLIAAEAALRDGGLDAAWRVEHEVGMVLGTHFGSVRTIAGFDRRGMEAGPKYVKPFDFANSVINAAAGQAAIWFDLRGLNATLSSGMTSGLSALAQGFDAIRSGRADQLLLGGADEICFESALACARAGLLCREDEDGRPPGGRPFDAGRTGFVLAEGAACVLAEDAATAAGRGARPLARLRGHGSAYDVSRGTDGEAAGRALATAIGTALADAGLRADEVDLVSAGAAGSPLLDRAEALGLALALGDRLAGLPLLAVKGALGEPLAAGGLFQLIAALDTFRTGELPGIPGFALGEPGLPALALSAAARSRPGKLAVAAWPCSPASGSTATAPPWWSKLRPNARSSVKRPFRGLRRRGPAPSYDVVVIGAGVGGLFCAVELARAGLAVLLVEQHYMVGGYCSTFRRGGFTFDAATHFYPLLGNPATLTGKIMAEIGLGELGWVRMDPVDTFHLPDGQAFRVPADYESYRAELARLFPEQQAALDAFFDTAREAYLAGLLAYFRERPTPRFERYAAWTLKDALERFIPDPRLRLLLAADCAHWGSRPGRTSFVFDSMLRFSYFLGNYYPQGGSQAFADALARRFEELGGDLMISTRASRILLAGAGPAARAAGVELITTRGPLTGRHRVAAGAVVSNADLLATLDQLLPADTVDPALRRQLHGLRPSFPCFLTHLGLEGIDREALEAVQGYYWQDWDSEQVGRNGLRCKIFAPTVYEPAMAPPGGQVVILQKVLDTEDPEIATWSEDKAAVENYLLDHFQRVLPGIDRQVVVKTSASAFTSWRFTLNHQGAMLGWEMAPDQLGEVRPGQLLDNLPLVGHWTRPGGGITPVIVSAIDAARSLLRGGAYSLWREEAARLLAEDPMGS